MKQNNTNQLKPKNMTIEALKSAKLSPITAGYLTIYLKLQDLYGEVSNVTEMNYNANYVDRINEAFTDALSKAQDEIMNLAVMSITEKLGYLDNNTEL